MKIEKNIPHRLSVEEAKKILDAFIEEVHSEFQPFITDWHPQSGKDEVVISFTANNMMANGFFKIHPDHILFTGALPIEDNPATEEAIKKQEDKLRKLLEVLEAETVSVPSAPAESASPAPSTPPPPAPAATVAPATAAPAADPAQPATTATAAVTTAPAQPSAAPATPPPPAPATPPPPAPAATVTPAPPAQTTAPAATASAVATTAPAQGAAPATPPPPASAAAPAQPAPATATAAGAAPATPPPPAPATPPPPATAPAETNAPAQPAAVAAAPAQPSAAPAATVAAASTEESVEERLRKQAEKGSGGDKKNGGNGKESSPTPAAPPSVMAQIIGSSPWPWIITIPIIVILMILWFTRDRQPGAQATGDNTANNEVINRLTKAIENLEKERKEAPVANGSVSDSTNTVKGASPKSVVFSGSGSGNINAVNSIVTGNNINLSTPPQATPTCQPRKPTVSGPVLSEKELCDISVSCYEKPPVTVPAHTVVAFTFQMGWRFKTLCGDVDYSRVHTYFLVDNAGHSKPGYIRANDYNERENGNIRALLIENDGDSFEISFVATRL